MAIENTEEKIEVENFSRFEINLKNKASLPIFQISAPKEDKKGILMVGDYVAEDLHSFLAKNGLRNRWFIASTTQSDAVPTQCKSVDLNMFTNKSDVGLYLVSEAKDVPFSTELGDGHYVDSNIFFPESGATKEWDILYPAKYYPTKKTEMLLEVARLNISIKIAIVGWPVISERKAKISNEYRDMIIRLSKDLPNVTIFDNAPDGESHHLNPDGSIVVGRYTKEEMRRDFYSHAKSVIFLSEETEAINRACTEALCCNVPILVSSSKGGLDDLVNDKTGVIIQRSVEGIVKGLSVLKAKEEKLDPRNNFLNNFGREKANKKLHNLIKDVSKGDVNLDNCVMYGGDLWTTYANYSQILLM